MAGPIYQVREGLPKIIAVLLDFEVIWTKSKRTPTFFGETFPNLPFKAVHDSSKSDLVDRFDDLVNNDNNNDNYNDKTSFVKYFYA